MPMFSFYTPWKHLKVSGFLTFSGGIEKDQWHEMRWWETTSLCNVLKRLCCHQTLKRQNTDAFHDKGKNLCAPSTPLSHIYNVVPWNKYLRWIKLWIFFEAHCCTSKSCFSEYLCLVGLLNTCNICHLKVNEYFV